MAISEFTRAIGVNPNYTNAYWMRGYSYEKLSQYYTAITDYTKAVLTAEPVPELVGLT